MRTWTRGRVGGPAAAGAGGPTRRDALLVVALSAVSLLEASLRSDLAWPSASALLTVVLVAALPWRRRRPLVVVVLTTLLPLGFALVQARAGTGPDTLATMLVLLVVPYAVFRWGSGHDRVWGGAVLACGLVLSIVRGGEGVPGAVAGIALVGGVSLVGALRRERVAARAQELVAVRDREREALARDLHDVVAHHVSAIAIRAQVASTAPQDSDLVAQSLGVIEREAQAVLTEMRSLVRTLRAPADYAPPAGLDSLAALATPGPPAVTVRVAVPGTLPDIVAATLHRIAQEAVTNARRHARSATAIGVDVATTDGAVRLTVRDDGAPVRASPGDGYGLRGTRERAALLGGSVEAGPDPAGGWLLRATLPVREAS